MLLPHQITGRLLEKGIRIKDIASDLHLLPSTVSSVIHKHRISKKVQEYIVEKLGENYEFVWGPRPNRTRNSKRR